MYICSDEHAGHNALPLRHDWVVSQVKPARKTNERSQHTQTGSGAHHSLSPFAFCPSHRSLKFGLVFNTQCTKSHISLLCSALCLSPIGFLLQLCWNSSVATVFDCHRRTLQCNSVLHRPASPSCDHGCKCAPSYDTHYYYYPPAALSLSLASSFSSPCIHKVEHFMFSFKVGYLLGYFGSICTLTLIKISDALVASMVGSARKVLTVVLSFIFFAKPFTFPHLLGASFFFAGLAGHILVKRRKIMAGGSISKEE